MTNKRGRADTKKKILLPLKPKWADTRSSHSKQTPVPLLMNWTLKNQAEMVLFHSDIYYIKTSNDQSSRNLNFKFIPGHNLPVNTSLLVNWFKSAPGFQPSLHAQQTPAHSDLRAEPWPQTSAIDFSNYLFTPRLRTFPAAWRASFALRRSAGLSLFQSLIIVHPAD